MDDWKGTKGSWEFCIAQSNKHTYIRTHVKTDESCVPEIIYEHRLTDEQCINEKCGCIEKEISNAKLIAAAPDLLEALQLVLEEVEWGQMSPTRKKVHKAINKALGK